MDLLTPLGLIIGLAAVVFVMMEGGIMSILLNPVAFIFVFGGTLGSTLITYPWKLVRKIPRAIYMSVFPKKLQSPKSMIEKLMRMAEAAHSHGIDELPDELSDEDDVFLKSGVRLLLKGSNEDMLRESLRLEIDFTRQRHQQVQKVFTSMGGYAPIFGLLGTLVGVIQVLKHIGDPTMMGTSMAVAIMTTFYGIFSCNFVFIPIAGKLESYSDDEMLLKEIALEGLICIKQQLIPQLMKEKLERIAVREKNEKNKH